MKAKPEPLNEIKNFIITLALKRNISQIIRFLYIKMTSKRFFFQ